MFPDRPDIGHPLPAYLGGRRWKLLPAPAGLHHPDAGFHPLAPDGGARRHFHYPTQPAAAGISCRLRRRRNPYAPGPAATIYLAGWAPVVREQCNPLASHTSCAGVHGIVPAVRVAHGCRTFPPPWKPPAGRHRPKAPSVRSPMPTAIEAKAAQATPFPCDAIQAEPATGAQDLETDW